MSNDTMYKFRLLYIYFICFNLMLLLNTTTLAVNEIFNKQTDFKNYTENDNEEMIYNSLKLKKRQPSVLTAKVEINQYEVKPQAVAGVSVALESIDADIVTEIIKEVETNIIKEVEKETEKEIVVEIEKPKYSDKEIEILQRIVEAEVTGGSIQAKMNVASVILNRVNSDKFPNTIKQVVFQSNPIQFSPIRDNRYYSVNITEETIIAVNNVIENGDCTMGALFFCNLNDVKNNKNVEWFNKLEFLFIDDVNHYFYK